MPSSTAAPHSTIRIIVSIIRRRRSLTKGAGATDARDASLWAMGLGDLELFEELSVAEAAVLEARMTPIAFPAGATVMRQGEAGEAFMLIIEGEAAVSRDGAEVGLLGPGSIVGELAVLRGAPRTATVVATSALVGLRGDADAFAALAEAPGVRERFGRTAAQRLAVSARPVPTTLRDGTEVQIRPIVPDDGPTFQDALDKHFSMESHRKRFFSPGHVSPALLSYLVDVNYLDHFAWVVVTMEDGALRGVASTRYIRLRDEPEVAEISLGVTDDYQGRGVGRLLMGALGAAAPVGDVQRFRASVLADNTPMRALLDRVGTHWQLEEPGVVVTTVDVVNFTGLLDDSTFTALQRSAHDIVAAAALALA